MRLGSTKNKLRLRQAAPVLLLIAGVTAVYSFRDPVLALLRGPLHGTLFVNQFSSDFSFLLRAWLLEVAIFAIPILIMLAVDHFVRPVSLASLRRWREWLILGAFGAALILPIAPDPVSQILLVLPVVGFYEFSMWLLDWTHRRPTRDPKPTAAPAPVAQPRLPMAIAVPNQRPRRDVRTPAPAARPRTPTAHPARSKIIDLREQK